MKCMTQYSTIQYDAEKLCLLEKFFKLCLMQCLHTGNPKRFRTSQCVLVACERKRSVPFRSGIISTAVPPRSEPLV